MIIYDISPACWDSQSKFGLNWNPYTCANGWRASEPNRCRRPRIPYVSAESNSV